MKKISTLLLAGALTLGLASCNQNRGTDTPQDAKSYAKLAFNEAGLRADSEGQVNAAGKGAESTIANAYFFVGTSGFNLSMTNVTGFTAVDPQEGAYESDVFEYGGPTGSQGSGMVVNIAGLTPADYSADTKISIDRLGELVASTGFTMSSKTAQTIDIDPAIDAASKVTDTDNTFTYQVERVVSKAQVSEKAGGMTVNIKDAQDTSITYPGTVDDKRYGVAGSALEVYLFADNAGDRVMTEHTAGTNDLLIYKNFKSAIDAVPFTTFNGTNFDVRRPLSKVSEGSLKTLSTDSDWATLYSLPIVNDANYASESHATNGIYFLENSMPDVTGKGVADYADITYLSITAKFEPTGNLFKLNAEKDGVVAADAADIAVERNETVKVSETWVNSLATDKRQELENAGKLVNVAASGDPADWELTMTVAANTFFYGKATKKLYVTLQAARVDGNKESLVYKAGKMLWRLPANKEKQSTADFYANLETRRNNIYSVEIQEINGLGFNYDPRDPENPNAPKPDPEDNPDEPETIEKDPVDPATVFMKTKAVVLKWNIVHRKVTL